ncbi:MAG TPA: barstar family protein [Pseudomonas sp.]|nr:barstar family protein [Pseudomonas sp.]
MMQTDANRSGVWRAGTANTALKPLPLMTSDSVLNKHSLLGALATALHFPAHFGHNWDAAWDCLSELDWTDRRAYTLQLNIAAESRVDEPELATFIDLFSEACELWLAQGQILTLLVSTDRDDLPCLQQLPAWPVA